MTNFSLVGATPKPIKSITCKKKGNTCTYTVVYTDTKGKTVTSQYGTTGATLPLAMQNVNGNINQAELEENLWKQTGHAEFGCYGGSSELMILERAEKLIQHYGEKDSEGEGEGVITPKEQASIMEWWTQWFGTIKKS